MSRNLKLFYISCFQNLMKKHVYLLCVLCKSFMACLQMMNDILTVKFHYLYFFKPLHLYLYRDL